jgi:uncharacterized protein (TIGR02266 family)
MAAVQDIRADVRVQATFRVRYSTLDQLVVAYSRDLSKGGMFLVTTRFLPVNAVLRVQLELPNSARTVSIIARVAFIRPADEAATSGQPAGMGVHFLDLSNEDLDELGRHIAVESIAAHTDSEYVRARPLEVLVVDDKTDLRELVAIPFRARGDRVRDAGNGVEALALCLRQPPDVILCDVAMPLMDGWQFLRVLRSRPSLSSIPVAFVTALTEEPERLRGFQLGVDDYITKPFRPAELVARIDRLVARSMRLGGIERKTLRGSLDHVPLPSVLTFLEMERQTGVLLVLREHRAARLFVREGRLLRIEIERATTGIRPDQMLFSVLKWPNGDYEFAAQDVSGNDEFQASITALLLTFSKLIDEKDRKGP